MNAHTPIPAAGRSVTKGDNRPPSLIELARETYRGLSAWLSDHPVISSHDEAKEAGKWIESVGMSIDELEAERRSNVATTIRRGPMPSGRRPLRWSTL